MAPACPDGRATFVLGATLPGLDAGHLLRTSGKTAVVHRQVLTRAPEGAFPHEPSFLTHVEPVCGTVDEIAEDLRQGLARCVRTMTANDVARERWGRYQRFLLEQGVTGLVKGHDERIFARADHPAVARLRAERERAHRETGSPLALDEDDFVRDLLFALGGRCSARQLAAMLTAYADHRDHADQPRPPIVHKG